MHAKNRKQSFLAEKELPSPYQSFSVTKWIFCTFTRLQKNRNSKIRLKLLRKFYLFTTSTWHSNRNIAPCKPLPYWILREHLLPKHKLYVTAALQKVEKLNERSKKLIKTTKQRTFLQFRKAIKPSNHFSVYCLCLLFSAFPFLFTSCMSKCTIDCQLRLKQAIFAQNPYASMALYIFAGEN